METRDILFTKEVGQKSGLLIAKKQSKLCRHHFLAE